MELVLILDLDSKVYYNITILYKIIIYIISMKPVTGWSYMSQSHNYVIQRMS